MAIAWMFQNSLLPSVAPVHHRPGLSLASTALSNLGGAAFLIVPGCSQPAVEEAALRRRASRQDCFFNLSGESSNPAIVPVASTTSAVVPSRPRR